MALGDLAPTLATAGPGGHGRRYLNGTAGVARFNRPHSIVIDGTRDVALIADTDNHAIRVVSLKTGATSTLAGLKGGPGTADGAAGAARFYSPFDIAIDGIRDVALVVDRENHAIRSHRPTNYLAGWLCLSVLCVCFADWH